MGRPRTERLTALWNQMEALPRDEKVTLYAGELAELVDRLLDLEDRVNNHTIYGAHSAAS